MKYELVIVSLYMEVGRSRKMDNSNHPTEGTNLETKVSKVKYMSMPK